MEQEQKIDIAILKEKVSKIEAWVDNAEANHFPTIERRFDALERKGAYLAGGIAAFGAIFQLMLKYFS